jgi:hypothetical protein
MPDIVFIGPGKRKEKYKHVLFVIEESDADGRPSIIRMAKEDELFDLAAADAEGKSLKFMTGYVLSHMTYGR